MKLKITDMQKCTFINFLIIQLQDNGSGASFAAFKRFNSFFAKQLKAVCVIS